MQINEKEKQIAIIFILAIGAATYYFYNGYESQKNLANQKITELATELENAISARGKASENIAKAALYIDYIDLILCPSGFSKKYECNERLAWMAELKKQGYALNDEEIKSALDLMTIENTNEIVGRILSRSIEMARKLAK